MAIGAQQSAIRAVIAGALAEDGAGRDAGLDESVGAGRHHDLPPGAAARIITVTKPY